MYKLTALNLCPPLLNQGTIICDVDANPPVLRTLWYFNQKLIQVKPISDGISSSSSSASSYRYPSSSPTFASSSTFSSSMTDRLFVSSPVSLSFRQMTGMDSGTYSCLPQNSEGQAPIRAIIYVKVKGKFKVDAVMMLPVATPDCYLCCIQTHCSKVSIHTII